jgi:hypothetical protein
VRAGTWRGTPVCVKMLSLCRTSQADLSSLSRMLAVTGTMAHENIVTLLAHDVDSSSAPPLRGWKLHLIEARNPLCLDFRLRFFMHGT